MLDPDNDGTVDLAEAKKAAAPTLFAKLDPDHDGTLDVRELRGRLTAKELKPADPDHDGTLTLDEYLAGRRAALQGGRSRQRRDTGCEGVESRAGRSLLRLLK